MSSISCSWWGEEGTACCVYYALRTNLTHNSKGDGAQSLLRPRLYEIRRAAESGQVNALMQQTQTREQISADEDGISTPLRAADDKVPTDDDGPDNSNVLDEVAAKLKGPRRLFSFSDGGTRFLLLTPEGKPFGQHTS